jgi:hypothetical protein
MCVFVSIAASRGQRFDQSVGAQRETEDEASHNKARSQKHLSHGSILASRASFGQSKDGIV